MNQHEKHKYFTSYDHRDPLQNQKQYATDFFENNAISPKKRSHQNQPLKKDQISKQINDQINKVSNEEFVVFNNGPDDRKIKTLIIDAISSADKAIKAILPYGHTEIQKYCSIYFLNKEKLLSFIDVNNRSFFSNSEKNSKKGQKRKTKKKDNGSSDLTQMVPINHLERLQKIVYNKIMPILQSQVEVLKRKSQKLFKKGKQWGNSDLRQGLQLLQRLNDKQRIAVDQCAQILEKFIVRIMEKQQKMLSKLNRLQERLDQQIKKTENLSEQSKKWEQYRAKTEKQWNKEKKSLFRYEQFSKEIKLMFAQKDKIGSQTSEKECLQDIMQQIKRMLNNQQRHNKHPKKCDHKPHKEAHASCKEQVSKNEQQIKSLKQVVKSLDNEICILRQQCQNMDNKLQHSHEKVTKFQSKSKKMIQENDNLNKKIEQMIKEQSYKSKLIQQYISMISKLQDTLRLSQQNLMKLNEQNDGYLQLIAKHSSQKDDYIKSMMEMQQKSKELEEIVSKKQIQIQELFNNLYAKQREIRDNQIVIQQLQKQIEKLYQLLKDKQETVNDTTKQIEKLNKEIKDIKQDQAIKLQVKNKKKNQTSVIISTEQIKKKEENQYIETLQSIENNTESGKHINTNKMQLLSHQYLDNSPGKLSAFRDQIVSNESIPQTIINQLNDIVTEKSLKGLPRDDFIPAQVNKQTLADIIAEARANQQAQVIVDTNDMVYYQNEKGIERPDFIDVDVNKQTQQEIQKEREEYISHLKDQLEPQKGASNIELNSHNSKDSKAKNEDVQYIKVMQNIQGEKKIKDSAQMKFSEQLCAIEAQSHKIQQLLDLNARIADHFVKLKQKMVSHEEFSADTAEIKQQMECLAIMLNMCKRSTLMKLQKIARTETLHQQAIQQIERLKHRLDDALITNQPFSNIMENSDGSGFTIPDHLQSFFRNNTIESARYNQQIYISRVPIKPKVSKDFFTQTDAEVQTTHQPIITIESEVVIQTSSPMVSLVDDKQAQADKSFIHELDIADISPVLINPQQRIQSIQNSDFNKDQIIPNSLKQTPIYDKEANPEIPNNEKQPNQMKEISSLIEYHKQQILNLHKLLRENNNQLKQHQQRQKLQTPQKHPLENSTYLRNIMNAPEKQKNPISQNSQAVEFHHETQIEQMKEMFTQRQQHFSQLVVQKDQEIQRLKSIIKTLTKAQEVDQKPSVKTSRNKEPISREMQNLKSENQQLWMFLEKEKSEIQRLQILIKQYQLHEELHKLKTSRPHREKSENGNQDIQISPRTKQIEANQGFVYLLTPAKRVNIEAEEIEAFKEKKLSKSQNIEELNNNHELLLQTNQKNELVSPPKQEESPTKKFARKSEKFVKQESPRQRRHTSPKMTMQFDWQDLVPQYFGGQKSKPSPRT